MRMPDYTETSQREPIHGEISHIHEVRSTQRKDTWTLQGLANHPLGPCRKKSCRGVLELRDHWLGQAALVPFQANCTRRRI